MGVLFILRIQSVRVEEGWLRHMRLTRFFVISSYSGNVISSAELSSIGKGSGPSSEATVEGERGLIGLLLVVKSPGV